MKKLFYLLLIILIPGCVTQTLLTQDQAAEIPSGSKSIQAHLQDPPVIVFKKCYTLLLENGYQIEKENSDMFTISTAGKDMGQKTVGRLHIYISNKNPGSQVNITSEWKPDSEMQMAANIYTGVPTVVDFKSAVWGESGRPAVVFSNAVVLAKQLSNTITYQK